MEALLGARAGVVVSAYVACGAFFLGQLDSLGVPRFRWRMTPRIATALLGVAVGCAIARAGWTRVSSVFGAMCIGVLAVSVTLFGVALFLVGWPPFVLLRVSWIALPIGAFLGFAHWNNLYRNVRPRRIPPSS